MDKVALLLKKKILKGFPKSRIVSFLYFGSRAFGIGVCRKSDYDFLLLVNDYSQGDSFKLRKITNLRAFKKINLNINLIYLSDLKIRGIENFQIRSLRPDFYRYLEGAKTLIGQNYFSENPIKISVGQLKEYLDFKIQEYYGRCDKLFMDKVSINDLTYGIKKYTKEVVRMFLIREGKILIGDIKTMEYEEIYNIALLNRYLTKREIYYLKSNKLIDIEKVRRKIYRKFLNISTKEFHQAIFSTKNPACYSGKSD